MRVRHRFVVLPLLLLTGCLIPSNVIAPEQRKVVEPTVTVPMVGAKAEDFDGLFESTAITGQAAASLRKVYYWFGRDGQYTGAALVQAGAFPAFQVLSGRWSLRGSEVLLRAGSEDDGDPAQAEAAPGWLRFTGSEGVVTLRKVEER